MSMKRRTLPVAAGAGAALLALPATAMADSLDAANSGGLGQSTWSVIPAGRAPLPSDLARLKTINYGGGARWFSKTHVAFSFDVRFYAINPGPASIDFPGSPRTTMLVIGAGVSLK